MKIQGGQTLKVSDGWCGGEWSVVAGAAMENEQLREKLVASAVMGNRQQLEEIREAMRERESEFEERERDKRVRRDRDFFKIE